MFTVARRGKEGYRCALSMMASVWENGREAVFMRSGRHYAKLTYPLRFVEKTALTHNWSSQESVPRREQVEGAAPKTVSVPSQETADSSTREYMEMKLRCRVPLFTYVVGSSADSLRLETKFKHDDLSVELSLSGDEPSVSDSMPAHSRHFRKVTSLHVFVEEVGIKEVTKSEYPKMLRILVPIVNRAIRHIRNFGFVPHISEISPVDDDAEYYLGRWEVELSEDGKNWKSVVADTLLATLLYAERTKKTGTLHAA